MASTKDVAIRIGEMTGEDAPGTKLVRTFLRSHTKAHGGIVGEDTPGKGSTYVIDADDVDAIATAFVAWRKAPNGRAFTFVRDDADDTPDA